MREEKKISSPEGYTTEAARASNGDQTTVSWWRELKYEISPMRSMYVLQCPLDSCSVTFTICPISLRFRDGQLGVRYSARYRAIVIWRCMFLEGFVPCLPLMLSRTELLSLIWWRCQGKNVLDAVCVCSYFSNTRLHYSCDYKAVQSINLQSGTYACGLTQYWMTERPTWRNVFEIYVHTVWSDLRTM